MTATNSAGNVTKYQSGLRITPIAKFDPVADIDMLTGAFALNNFGVDRNDLSSNKIGRGIMRNLQVGTCAALMLITTGVFAQTPPERPRPTPEEAQKIMDSALGAMGPMMGRMAESMIQAELKIAEKPETAEAIATFKRNLYESLVKKGFKPGEALQIVLATGLPSAAPMSR